MLALPGWSYLSGLNVQRTLDYIDIVHAATVGTTGGLFVPESFCVLPHSEVSDSFACKLGPRHECRNLGTSFNK